MTIASVLIDRAAVLIGDASMRRWTPGDWLSYLNDARRALIELVPQAATVNAPVQLVAGTKQTLPTNAVSLVDIPRNMGTDGTTPGRRIIKARMEDLSRFSPNWQTDTAISTVNNYIWDHRDPLVFYVTPPNDGTGYVELVYFSSPAAITNKKDTGIMEVYDPRLLNYMFYRAYAKNTDTGSDAKSTKYYELFAQGSGGNGQ